jgi:phenylalanyl-tRNA synthetase beta chain
VGVADLDVEALAAAGAPALARPFAPFSAYPAVLRDLAVVVDEAVSAAEVEAVIRRAGGPLLLEVRLFDVYRGLQVGLGRKSLAWSLTFQSGQETLTGEVADALRGQVAQALAAELGGVVR